MRYNRLDLNLLPALRALLTEKNVTRAGKSLHVTQPAMSRMLSRLREYFDDPLIVPVGRRMELTPLAEGLAERVNHLLLHVDATLNTQPAFDPSQSTRHYTVMASDYVASVLMLDVVREVSRVAPAVSIELVPLGPWGAAALSTGEIDFMVQPQRFCSAEHPTAKLFEDTYHGVVDRGHETVGDTVTFAQYMALDHVTYRNRGWPLFGSFFEKGLALPKQPLVSVNMFALLAPMVVGTPRIATMQSRMATRLAETLPVRLVRLDFETPRLAEVLQWHPYRDADPGNLWLRELIRNVAARLSPLPGNCGDLEVQARPRSGE